MHFNVIKEPTSKIDRSPTKVEANASVTSLSRKFNLSKTSALFKKSATKYSDHVLEQIDFKEIGKEEDRKTLLATKSSLELINKSLSKCEHKVKELSEDTLTVGDVEGFQHKIVQPVDSLHKHRKSLIPQVSEANQQQRRHLTNSLTNNSPVSFKRNIIPSVVKRDVEEMPSLVSKLSFTNDSLQYHRQSLLYKSFTTSALSLTKDSVEILQVILSFIEQSRTPLSITVIVYGMKRCRWETTMPR